MSARNAEKAASTGSRRVIGCASLTDILGRPPGTMVEEPIPGPKVDEVIANRKKSVAAFGGDPDAARERRLDLERFDPTCV